MHSAGAWLRKPSVGRKGLNDIASIVTPDTLMAWHRKLIAIKWDHPDKRRPGRPRTIDIAALIVRMASENRSGVIRRIQGALANLGHQVARGTVANILKAHGIDPAPRRGKRSPWETFLKAHWEVLAATDFFTVETLQGLVTHYVLFFIELATRSVHIAGITTNPNELFILQVGRNLTDIVDGFLLGKRYLIVDRDTKYSQAFRGLLERGGIESIRLPPRSPNLNAYAARFVRSIKEEMILFR